MTFDRTAQQKQCVGLIAFHWVFFCRREALFYNDRINGATKYVRTVLILNVQDIKKTKKKKQNPVDSLNMNLGQTREVFW